MGKRGMKSTKTFRISATLDCHVKSVIAYLKKKKERNLVIFTCIFYQYRGRVASKGCRCIGLAKTFIRVLL